MAVQLQSPNQLQEFLGILRRRKWQVVLPAALVLAVGVAVANFLPKSYTVSTVLAVRESTLPGTNAIQRDVGSISMEIMSQQRVREVIHQQEWQDYAGLSRAEQLRYEQRVGGNIRSRLTQPGGKQGGGTDFITITYTDSDGPRAERFLNTLREHYIESVMQRMRERAAAVLAKRKEVRLDREEAYNRAAEQHKQLVAINNLAMTDPGTQRGSDPAKVELELAERDLRTTQTELETLRGKRAATYELFEQEPLQIPLATAPPVTNDVAVEAIDQQIKDKRSKQDGYRPAHSTYRTLEAEIAALEEQREELLAEAAPEAAEGAWIPNPKRDERFRELQDLDLEIATLEKKQAKLEADIVVLDKRHNALLDVYRDLRVIGNDVTIRQDYFNDAAAAYDAQLMLVQVLEGPEANPFEIIEYAAATDVPTAPNVSAIVAFAAVLGLGLGLGSALAAEYLRNGYRSVGELTRSLAVPVLGAINGIVTRQEARRRTARRIMVGSSSLVLIGAILWVTWAYKNKPLMLGDELIALIDGFREQFR